MSDAGCAAAKGPSGRMAGARLLVLLSPRLISPIAPLVLWETGARLEWLDPRLVAPPSLVIVELWHLAPSGDLVAALAASLWRVVVGFPAGRHPHCARCPHGAGAHGRDHLRSVDRTVATGLSARLVRSFHSGFGIGEASKIFIIAFACSFPIILNTYAGVRGMDATYFRAARSLGASPWEIMHGIVLRGSPPHIFTGMRLAWGIALIVIVAAEMIGAVRGIGYMVLGRSRPSRSRGFSAASS